MTLLTLVGLPRDPGSRARGEEHGPGSGTVRGPRIFSLGGARGPRMGRPALAADRPVPAPSRPTPLTALVPGPAGPSPPPGPTRDLLRQRTVRSSR
ncbi:hypothetical protein AVL59_14170 [Streptomyces griseochromogenes]|uniref:Uncharacterized protein n=1 Tax=Streptomyces griseochromogenes TaxID=68214 RepID=A0A1B1AVK7_9ACTN|nr:hypothetical protein AVL59_14170 [Streptomyces griseochromogenes]